MSTLQNHKIYLILFLLSTMILAASLYQREITYDEAFFAEQAYWVDKVGYARTELFNNVLDWGDRQYVYHKLHVWQTALMVKVIGWSPYYFKAAPLAYLCIFVYFAYVYYRKYLSPDDTRPFYLFLSLLLINTYIVHFAFENRPEIMVMCAGFVSFLSLRQGIKSENTAYVLLSGLLAGTAVLFHLNGLIYITAGIGLIVYMRHYRYLAWFVVAAGLMSSLYWYEMIANNAVDLGIAQLRNDPAVTSDGLSFTDLLLKLLYSLKRFGQHLFDLSYTLLLVLALYFYRATLKEIPEVKLLLVYFVVAELTLAIIGPGAKAMYLVLHLPYVLFIITMIYSKNIHKPLHSVMLFAFLFYAITQIGHVYSLIKHRNSEIIQQHSQIVKKHHIQKTDKILAPAVFIFNEIESAQIGATEMLKGLAISRGLTNKSEAIFNYTIQHNYQFLILPKYYLGDFSDDNFNLGQVHHGYQVIGNDYGYHIFRREQTSDIRYGH